MERSLPHLSVIIPVYNAEGFLAKTLSELDGFLCGLAFSSELILVDDGGADRSFEIASAWAGEARPYAVRALRHERNQGKGGAVATGMLAAAGKFRIFIDVDLAYPPSQILRILEALEEGADVATACRVHPESRYTISPAFFHYLYTRHLASRVINWALRHTLIPNCSDSQAGLKGFRAEAAKEIFSRQRVKGFPFDVEALFLAGRMGYRTREVAVEFRYFNEPTTVQFLQDGTGMIADVVRVRLNSLRGRYHLPESHGRRRLVINADDYGMTLPVSRGILKAAASGAVRSTSAMANSPAFEESMDELIRAEAKPEVGFHATLTWGRPLSDPKQIPTLVDKEGAFLSRGALLQKSLRGAVSEEEAYLELRAQCERLAKRWPEIGHLDGHHHVHCFPTVCNAAARVAREFHIRIVRAPYEGRWSSWHAAFFRRLAIASLPASRPAFWLARGFICADRFGGFALGAHDQLASSWNRTLTRLPGGTTEIMVHPGYESDNRDGYNVEREKELELLADPAFAQSAKAAGVRLISFREMISGD